MKKEISFFEFQSVKSVAKAIEPYLQKKERLIPQIQRMQEDLEKRQKALEEANEEYTKAIAAINAYEQGVVNIIGFHANDLVTKVTETSEKDGKIVKSTKWVPSEIVSYDEVAKKYIITVPDAPDETNVA